MAAVSPMQSPPLLMPSLVCCVDRLNPQPKADISVRPLAKISALHPRITRPTAFD